jgi:uncharacterized membrane protein YdjX (TVP38/TMEM64 family)
MSIYIKILAGLVGLTILAFAGREIPAALPRFTAWVASLGAWGPLAFIVGYSIAPVILAPAFLLTIAAGAIFGFFKGVLYVMIGATIGATLAFLTGRYLARHFVEGLLAREPRLAAIDRAVERQGVRQVVLRRMSPPHPNVLHNKARGLSRVKLVDDVPATIGMLPVVAMYVYSGKIAGDLASLAAGAAAPKGTAYYVLIGLGFASTLAVTLVVTRIARQAIAQEVDEGERSSR